MNRKKSVIGGLDRILSAHQASALPVQSCLSNHRRNDLHPQGSDVDYRKGTQLDLGVFRKAQCQELVLGSPLPVFQGRYRPCLAEGISPLVRMGFHPAGVLSLWARSSGNTPERSNRKDQGTSGTARTTCFTQRCQEVMESTGRVTIKKTAGQNGMTDYYLEYNPPVEIPGVSS